MLKKIDDQFGSDVAPVELREWRESLTDIRYRYGDIGVRQILDELASQATSEGVESGYRTHTPYVNTIAPDQQPEYPGDLEVERRIENAIRWNAMMMVSLANKRMAGTGGHISTYASAATLYEVGFNHFFRGPEHPGGGDFVYFQGHASPGPYARAFLEGRLSEQKLENFRRELADGGGLCSYPHPWLMPDFWSFPTVSMGLGPLTAIYHARFLKYLTNRELKDCSEQRIFAYLGDGEMDEPESLGAISIAAREQCDNLTFVVNCNLQRLDGPVRGNGKIIQEMEGIFAGAGWNVVKVVWGSAWDPLFRADKSGKLVAKLGATVDGQFQKYSASGPDYIREHFFGSDPDLAKLVEGWSDERISGLQRGGHDPVKVYAAYENATTTPGRPTVILAKTVKGYGLGSEGHGMNVAHNTKKITYEGILAFRDRFDIPLTDDQVETEHFYRPADDSDLIEYLHARRKELGGYLPSRTENAKPLPAPTLESLERNLRDSGGKEVSSTFAYVNLISSLLRDKDIGKYVVPIIPDEARTFGMEGLFKQVGIYAPMGQLYEPVDRQSLSWYKESETGQVLEEGINEAGAMASFVAAGTAYANHGVNTIPFYIYYSMFGFQRVGDLAWLAGDSRCKGFLLGATSGRTSLNGEGLQHQDGHSLLAATTIPNLLAYDPAYGYEVTVIIRDGIRRMYENGEHVFYYICLYNDSYEMPAMPEGSEEGILQGMYKLKSAELSDPEVEGRPQLLGSGAILPYSLMAQKTLADDYGVAADVWSVTSYKELRREALAAQRWNRLHPTKPPRGSYLEQCLGEDVGPVIASSDNMKLVAEQIEKWVPGGMTILGTDGFGRSETRPALRRHFEIDAEHIVYATLHALAQRGQFDKAKLPGVIEKLGIDPDAVDPVTA